MNIGDDVETEDALTPAEQIESTAWQVLRAAYLRCACHYLGQSPAALDEDEQNELLERWFAPMARDLELLRACFDRAHLMGVQALHTRLHVGEAIDDEMLDEAAEYAVGPGGLASEPPKRG